MALSETIRSAIEKVRGQDIDSIASSLSNPKPPKNPPHIDNINLLTSAMLEQAHPPEENLPNSSLDTVRRPLARVKHVVFELAHGAAER